jgi:CDP-2,3-bis-(O-geranylgeranyl)-sn-glycerol synthase
LYLVVFLPVLGAYLAHAPVLRYDLLRSLKHPLDGGATFRGRRVFGDNKTWRGVIVMFAGTFAAAIILTRFGWYRDALPDEVAAASPAVFGVLVGIGTVAGELPNSFLKRQLGISPGAQRRSGVGIAISIFDQADIVIGIWICLLPIWAMSVGQGALAFAVFAAFHLAVSAVGVALGARKTVL